jgi:hypothetical protein
MKFRVDETGAEVNLMDEKSFKKLRQKPKPYAGKVSLMGTTKHQFKCLASLERVLRETVVTSLLNFV